MARAIFHFFATRGSKELLEIQLQSPPPPIRFKRLFSTFKCVFRELIRTIRHEDDRVLF